MVGILCAILLAAGGGRVEACSYAPGYQPPVLLDRALAAGFVITARHIRQFQESSGGVLTGSSEIIAEVEVIEYLKGK